MSARQSRAIGKQNAALARAEAAATEDVGRMQERRARDRMDRLIGIQRGQFAARGVRLDSPTAQDFGAEAATERALEGQAARFTTSQRSTALRNEGRLSEYRGRADAMMGLVRTGANTITGGLNLWPELAGL